MNDKGFSLVELIVTVLVLAILTTAAVVSFTYYKSADTDSCVKKLEVALEKTRLETMSRTAGSVSMKLYFDMDKSEYCADIIYLKTDGGLTTEEIIDSYELGDEMLTVRVAKYASDGITETGLRSISETGEARIRFEKQSGIYQPDSDGLYFSRITVQGTKTESIILVKDTGRSYVE